MPRLRVPILPLVSIAGLLFAIVTVIRAQRVEPAPPPLHPPVTSPFGETIAGAGLIEPGGERVTEVGVPFGGLVVAIHRGVGAIVTSGTPLFSLDDRALRAEVRLRETARDVARARLARLEALPRPEEVAPLVVRVEEARTTLSDFEAHLERQEAAAKATPGVVPLDELDRKRWQVALARKSLARAEAELALVRAGAWAPDLASARAEVEQTEAALAQAETELERSVVRAPSEGTVLSVNIRPGQYVTPGGGTPPVTLGDTRQLIVRADVDEESASLVREGAKAVAVVRGLPHERLPLRFVRIEPNVRPKRSLTGDTQERVDTRVLQVLFELGRAPFPLYVGQQVEVFMEGGARREP